MIQGEQMEQSAGKKFDKGKARLELLPPTYWVEVNSRLSANMAAWYFYEDKFPANFGFSAVPILEFGAEKYAAHNWFKGMRWGRLVGAFHRHCNKFENGLWVPRDLDDPDVESKMPHGQHAECCRVFLLEFYAAWKMDKRVIGENDCAWNDPAESVRKSLKCVGIEPSESQQPTQG